MDIRRKIELWIGAFLTGEIAELKTYPEKADEAIVPPFCVVACDEDEDRLSAGTTCQVTADVMYVTHIDDSRSSGQAAMVRAIRRALLVLPRGFQQVTTTDGVVGFTVHGSDVMGSVSVSDTEGQSHGTAIQVVVGASDDEG